MIGGCKGCRIGRLPCKRLRRLDRRSRSGRCRNILKCGRRCMCRPAHNGNFETFREVERFRCSVAIFTSTFSPRDLPLTPSSPAPKYFHAQTQQNQVLEDAKAVRNGRCVGWGGYPRACFLAEITVVVLHILQVILDRAPRSLKIPSSNTVKQDRLESRKASPGGSGATPACIRLRPGTNPFPLRGRFTLQNSSKWTRVRRHESGSPTRTLGLWKQSTTILVFSLRYSDRTGKARISDQVRVRVDPTRLQ